MEIKLFEAFAGVGSQHTAFNNLSKKYNFDFEVSGISEWNIASIIGYMKINNIKLDNPKTGFSKDDLINYLSMFNYSIDSKELIKDYSSLSYETLDLVFAAQHILNNTPDINNLKGKSLVEEGVNVFTYSFPCQDLSIAGKRKGMSKGNGTRSGLLWQVERILDEALDETLKEKKYELPKYLLMENVPQIVSDKHIEDYKLWKEYLRSIGYTTFDGIVNPKEFRFPQSRSRFFALSVRDYNGDIDPDIPIFDHIKTFKYNEFDKQPTMASCLRTKYDGVENIEYLIEALESTPNHTQSRLDMFANERPLTDEYGIGLKNTKKDFYHCSTITTKQDRWHNAGVINFDRKTFEDGTKSTHRLITPRESFLLMGYTEKQFNRLKQANLTNADLYQLAGNSIIPPVLELIFETFILSNYLGINND